jgi:hypothetical protein
MKPTPRQRKIREQIRKSSTRLLVLPLPHGNDEPSLKELLKQLGSPVKPLKPLTISWVYGTRVQLYKTQLGIFGEYVDLRGPVYSPSWLPRVFFVPGQSVSRRVIRIVRYGYKGWPYKLVKTIPGPRGPQGLRLL